MTPDLERLVDRVLARLAAPATPARVIIGITGTPGAGKTTLALALVAALTKALDREITPPVADSALVAPVALVAHVPMDGFHLADVELERLGLRQNKGAPQTFDAAGYTALLRRLHDNTDDVVYAPAFERTLEQPVAGSIPIHREVRVIVTEGNYLLLDGAWAGVRPLIDESWYCTVDEKVRLERLLARHVRFGKAPEEAQTWVQSSDQPNAELVAASQERADLVITL